VEELEPRLGVGVGDFDVAAEDSQFALFESGHGLLDDLDAERFLLAVLSLNNESLVNEDELSLLFEEGLGLNREFSLFDVADGLDEEWAHEASPFGLGIHVGLEGNVVISHGIGLVAFSIGLTEGSPVFAILSSVNDLFLVISGGESPGVRSGVPSHEGVLITVDVKVLSSEHNGRFVIMAVD